MKTEVALRERVKALERAVWGWEDEADYASYCTVMWVLEEKPIPLIALQESWQMRATGWIEEADAVLEKPEGRRAIRQAIDRRKAEMLREANA